MAGKERENFCRNAILIVDHAKDSLVDVLELHLTINSLSFEDFINLHQHDIYHLCFNKRQCCQCPQGYVLPHNRVLHPSQLEILLDKYGVTRPCHVPGRRFDFCCCLAKPGVTTNVLDITLVRCLLINFCDAVFWHSCLTLRSNTLEDFLNQNQHQLYHLANVSTPCCRCPPGYVFPVARPLLDPHQWNFLFNALALPCALHRNILSSNICWVLASSGIDVIHLSKDLSSTILEQCCSLRKSIYTLLQMRNNVYGHAKKGRITDVNYRIYKNEIESAILEIAKACGNEIEKKQILMDVEKRSLDETLCIQYKNTLLEWIARDTRLEEKLDDLAEKMPEIVEKAVVKAFDGDTKQKLTKDQQIRKEKLKEDAHSCIQTHIAEETFVKTNLISEGLQKLNENGIVILTGIPGIGKSRNSRELLHKFCTENQGYSAIWLSKRLEWSELINADDKLIVLIDDVFGRTNDTFDRNEDIKLLDIIYSTIQRGTVKVILTMRNTIKLALSDVVDSHRMLKGVNFLNISSDRLQMTTDEKKECLLNHCKKNNIWEQKSGTEEINSDDAAILDPKVPVYLGWTEIHAITKINVCPLLGFPESCYLFASNRKFTCQGVAFFKHPTQALCDEISNIRTSGKHDDSKALEYAILVYITLNGDCFDPFKINCDRIKQIIESIYGSPSINLTTIKTKKCIWLLMGRYLKLKEDKVVCFQHRTIFESVLLSYKDDDPELVIPLLDKDFLLELGCLENYEPQIGEVTFKFYSENYKQLANQLVNYLNLAGNPNLFISTLCSSRIIRYADKSMLEEFYNAYRNSKLDVCIRMRYLGKRSNIYRINNTISVQEDHILKMEFTLLEAMLQYSINATDNANVIIDILDLISKEMNVHNAKCVKERYTCCFTYALLQTCASNDKAKLNAISNFIKTKRIKLDEKIILSFNTKSSQLDTFKLLVGTLIDCELIDVNVLMKRVVALDDVSLVYAIIDQYDCKSYDIQSAMNTACEKESVNIVRWFCEHFGISVFDMQSLMFTVCKHGHIEIVKLLLDKSEHKMFDLDAAMNKSLLLTVCEHGHIEIVKLLLDKLEHKMFDLDAAMNKSMNCCYFNIVYVLLTSTNHSFKVKEIMDTILHHNVNWSSREINTKDCFILVKYLLETYCISNFDLKVVIIISSLFIDSDILQLVLQMMDINDFYQIWIKLKHCKHHRTMVLEQLFRSGCCTDKDVLTLMNTEMRHHNINGIKYLMGKFDWRYFDINTVIEYSFCYHCYYHNDYRSELMLWILKTFGYDAFNMHSILEAALQLKRWDLVKWILLNIGAKMFDIKLVIQSLAKYTESGILSWMFENFDHRLFDLQSMMTSACTYDNISLVKSMINTFGIEMFQSKHIMPIVIRNLKSCDSDIIKLCLKNSLNIGEYNMIKLFNMACRHQIIELIEWLLVHYDPKHFHFNSAITELKLSGYNNDTMLKLLLIKLDHTFLDIESIIQCLCRNRQFDIVMWLLDTFDPHLADIRFVMSKACQYGALHVVQCIIRQYGIRMFNIESIFDDACKNESSSLLVWLYQNFENSHICNLNNFHNYSFRNIIFSIENCKMNTSDYNAIFNHLSQTLHSEIYMELLTCLFDTMAYRLFDLKLVFNHVCRYGTTNFVKWMMNAFDHTLFDFQSAILEAVKNDNFELVTFLLKMRPVKPNFDVNSVFLEACYHNNVQLVNWLLDKFDHRMFSISEGISRSCSQFGCEKFIMNLIERCQHNLIDFSIVIQATDNKNISFTFVKRLMKIADNSKVAIDVPFIMHQACNRAHPDWDFVKFMLTTNDYKVDMKLIFNSACRTGTPEIVKWLLDDYGRGMFDLKSGFTEACCKGRLDIVKLLLDDYGRGMFDLKSGFNEACCKGKLDIVKLLIESFGTENFDLQSAISTFRCGLEYDEIVKYLLTNIQPSVSDLQCVMDKVCATGNIVLVNWLIESFDCSELEFDSTIGRIFDEKQNCEEVDWSKIELRTTTGRVFDKRHPPREVLKLLLQSFDHERFDMMLIIFRANLRRYRELVFMMIKTIDHSFSDTKTVLLLEICKRGDLETVTYLIETCHYEDLVDEAFILNAFRTGSSDIVKWLLHKRKGEISDTKTAMSNACIGGHTQLVQYLLVNYNVKHFDLRSAINVASYYGRTEVVQYFLQVFHYERFNMDAVMYHARASGHIGLVKWLLGVYDHEIFNIDSGVIEDVKNELAKR